MSQQRCIYVATLILQKNLKFSAALRTWKVVVAKTWVIFKDHFREARNELEELEELGRDTVFSANMIQGVVDGVRQMLIESEETKEDEAAEPPTIQNPSMNGLPQQNDPFLQSLQEQLAQQQQTLQ